MGRAGGVGGAPRLTRPVTRLTRRQLVGGAALLLAPSLCRAQSAAPPRLPPAEIDDTLEIAGESVAARLARTRLSVPVQINGQGPFRFLVDSGADRTVIGLELARALALPPGARVLLHSATADMRVDTVLLSSLRIGASEINAIAAPALPQAYLGAQGLIGIDALADQRLLLDFDRRRVIVQDSRHARAPALAAGEIVVVARRRNGQLILTQARVGRVPVAAVIDSGAEVTIGNRALRDRLFARRNRPQPQTVEIVDVTGTTIQAESLLVPTMAVGSIELQGVPLAFLDAPPFALFGLADQPAMLLGTDVLSAFSRVALDFRARRVRFLLKHG